MDFLKLKQFSPSHLALLLFTLLFTLVFYFVFRKKTAKTKTIIAFIFSIFAFLAIVGTNVYYALNITTLNVFDFLPLQLSQISIILMLFACFLKSNKFKSITFFIASFSAIYGLLVLESNMLSTATLNIDTALYFLPYFFLLVASFMLLSNIKVKLANIVSAYSLLVVLTSFAYTANLVFMEYFTNTGILNYFYTIFPRDIVMDFIIEYLPFPFVYLMPLTVVYLVFSFITFGFAKLTRAGSDAQLQQKLPKWEIDNSNELQPEVKESDLPEKEIENTKKEESQHEEPKVEEKLNEPTEEKTEEIKEEIKEESKDNENKDDEYENLNSYLDSILPPIVEEDTSKNKEQKASQPQGTEETTFDINEILPPTNKDEKPKEEKIEVQSLNIETPKEKQPEITQDTTPSIVLEKPNKEVEKTEQFEQEKKVEDKKEEPLPKPMVEEVKEEEKPKQQESKVDDDYNKYTSFDDYDFMKELEDFKKMLNESDAKLFGSEKQDSAASTEKPITPPAPENKDTKNKKTNLDLLKALKNKVDKNNN